MKHTIDIQVVNRRFLYTYIYIHLKNNLWHMHQEADAPRQY